MEKTRTYLHLTNEGELEFVVSRAINVKELADDEIKVMLKHTKSSLMKRRNDYKQQRDELSEKLDKECNDNYKLEGQLHDMTKQRDELKKDIQTQMNLLKEFSKFIDYKLYIHPGNCTYLSYRNELDQLGICKERD